MSRCAGVPACSYSAEGNSLGRIGSMDATSCTVQEHSTPTGVDQTGNFRLSR